MPIDERAGAGHDETAVRLFLTERVAERCHVTPDEIDPDRPLAELGLGSRDAVGVVGELEDLLGRSLPATLLYEHPTITRLARALAPLERERATVAVAGRADEPIAVIGLGCRFPGGVQGPEAYWRFLLDRGDAIGEPPAARPAMGGRPGGYLADVAGFDSRFFAIPPDEADAMDPQQRMLLEVAWDAFEHAAIGPASLAGTRTGVFVGISSPEYALLTTADPGAASAWTATGVALSIAANRLSYLLDLRGPSISVDTACSSSLVAVHLAVRSLRDGESDLAIAGGVNVLLSDTITKTFDLAGGTAPDGHCKPFDAAADGMVRSEGCGLVVLKRLGDAQRDGDRVLAVIQRTGVNSDGRSNGLAAPSPEAQQALLREVYAGLEPPGYVEAHGTGTLLGDPIEAGALGGVLGRDRTSPLLIGSVKSNLGHLEPAAGAAGLIKTVLALWHRTIPPSLHFHTPNPYIDFDGLGLKVVTERTPWPHGAGLAGVSSFGFGGTNAHVALAAAPPEPSPAEEEPAVHTLLLSDVAADRLGEYAGRLADEQPDLTAAAHTLARRHGRGRFGAAVVGRDHAALAAGLRALRAGRPGPAVVTGVAIGPAPPVWVFSGYGSQRPGMAWRLVEEEPAFAVAVGLLEPLVRREAGFSLRGALDPLAGGTPDPAEKMVTLFAVQVALARLWQAYGVEPAAVIGHSMGEVAAAVVAGALAPPDGVAVIARRARLLAGISGGGTMAVIGALAGEVAEMIAGSPGVHVAVRSSPRQTVITGDTGQVTRIVALAEERGLLARVVRAEGAGHSPQVDPLLAPLRARLRDIRPAAPTVAYYSATLDDPRAVPAFDADYWAANLRNTVRLTDAVRAAADDGHRTFVEISPHPLLAHALADTVPEALVLPTLRRQADDADDTLTFHAGLAALRLSGADVRLPAVRRIIDVPRPPWRHQHHWARTRPVSVQGTAHPLLGAHVELPGEDRHAWSANIGADPPAWLPLHGVTVLPAAAYAEIALAAGTEAMGPVAVTDLRVERLLALDDHTTITTVCAVTPRGRGNVLVQARTPAATWVTVARATVGPAKETAGTFDGGRVAVPPSERPDARFRADPVVLDRCLAAFGSGWTAMGIGSLRVPGRTAAGGHCEYEISAPDGDGAVGAMRLVDDAGNVLMEASGVALRRIPAASVPVALPAKLVEVTWERAILPAPPAAPGPAEWLVLSDPGDSGAAVVSEALVAAGHTVTGCDGAAIGPGAESLGEALVTAAERTPAGPVNVAVAVPPRLTDELLLLTLGAVVLAMPPGSRLWVLTRRVIAVRDGEPGEPGQAFVRALIRVLGFERAALRATLVDADDPAAFAAELLGGSTDTEVAWRSGVRYVARLRAARLGDTPPSEVVRPGGAYVISGGYGGLGLVTAEWLAGRGARRLVLSGRSGPRPRAAAAIERMRAAGTEVEVVLGDIAAPGVAESLVAAARADGVRLRGVVHAAGAMEDRIVTEIGTDDLRRVWSPKVGGALRLHEATRRLHLDWWVVYSSAAALLGSPGQGAYAAANARADALVDQRRAHGLPATTINWGTWGEVGGAAGLKVAALDPMTSQEGIEALEALLARDRPATGVLRFNPERARAAFPEIRDLPYYSELAGGAGPDDGWAGTAALRDAGPATARRLVGDRVRARVSAVLGFSPEPARPLTEQGLDSLVAVRVKGALEADFGVTVAASTLLQGASLTALQADLCERLGLPALPSVPSSTADLRVLRPLTDGARRHRADPTGDLDVAPFFCAHPAGGSAGVYRQLATLVGEDLAFYGLERFEDDAAVEERADRYVALIRAVQPSGPYRLGGWSFGGVLAYEIARRIGGAEVELVAMIDAGLPRLVDNVTDAAARRYADFGAYLTSTYGVTVALRFEELAALDEDAQLALVIERTRPVMDRLPSAVAVHQFTSHEDTRALERYRPGPYGGRVVLYRSTEPTPWTVHDPRYDLDEANGFGELCSRLEIVPIPGSHHLNLLDPPAVLIIADHLRDLLGGSGTT